MGIRLDWEIEAEQEQFENGREDPEARRQRRRAQLRFFLVVLAFTVLIGGVVGAAALRLRFVDWQMEQLLRDTVSAEIAALRIGDETAFMSMQRSASDIWMADQRGEFEAYQTLKTQANTAFTGEITGVVIDRSRARVQVREIIGGVAYERLWFYWQYSDGWRHVPPDTTFWGETRTLESDAVRVTYSDADAATAQQVFDRLQAWLQTGCGILPCGTIPQITVEIIPDSLLQPGWLNPSSWSVRLPSPLLDRRRVDSPFDPPAQLVIANGLAERLFAVATSSMEMMYPADAYYLKQAVISWFAGRFAGTQTNSFLIDSFVGSYGEAALGEFVRQLQPNSSITLFASLANVPTVADVNVDWRDYLTWRLALEGELITRHAQNEFQVLYDLSDPTARDLATVRYVNAVTSQGWVVTNITRVTDGTGAPLLQATVQGAAPDQVVNFRLADGVWKRAN
ncbi:MAG: hypothetical protein U0670_06215 [Anaerolineae bacterium]